MGAPCLCRRRKISFGQKKIELEKSKKIMEKKEGSMLIESKYVDNGVIGGVVVHLREMSLIVNPGFRVLSGDLVVSKLGDKWGNLWVSDRDMRSSMWDKVLWCGDVGDFLKFDHGDDVLLGVVPVDGGNFKVEVDRGSGFPRRIERVKVRHEVNGVLVDDNESGEGKVVIEPGAKPVLHENQVKNEGESNRVDRIRRELNMGDGVKDAVDWPLTPEEQAEVDVLKKQIDKNWDKIKEMIAEEAAKRERGPWPSPKGRELWIGAFLAGLEEGDLVAAADLADEVYRQYGEKHDGGVKCVAGDGKSCFASIFKS